MIKNKNDLIEYLTQDAKACRRDSVTAKFVGDEIWKFQVLLRNTEYYYNKNKAATGISKLYFRGLYLYHRLKFNELSVKLGFTIPINVIGKGLSIAHYGTIVVNSDARIGNNCRLQEGVNIGSTSGSSKAPIIGDNVFIGTGVKIIGDIRIADNVAIGANAVVVKSITEPATTWGGVPAKKISDKDSSSNLSPLLFED